LVPQAGRHHPGDLRRDVRTERQGAAGLAVDEREHVALHVHVGPGRQHVRELERGRDDLAIAPPPKHAQQRGFDVPLALGLVRQIDPRALRELSLTGLHGAPTSRCATVFIRCTVAQPGSYSISVIPAGAASSVQSRSSPRPSAPSTITRATTPRLTWRWPARAQRPHTGPAPPR